MERIRKIRHLLPLFLVAAFLFLIPFFWFRSGEMDLGGDSSRLYFYDPLGYLLSSTLYGVSASAFGLETIYYFNIPFVILLMILKLILGSPALLISVFHGLSLSVGFIFIYLIIRELIGGEDESKVNLSRYAAILGGIFYTLSPALIDGWSHVLLSHNQVFLNPLLFYLLLKYFKTSNTKYIYITILLTFIFSPSFSIISSPPIFAFYPISILFLIFYTKLILKRKILLKHLFFGVILFLGVQVFHLAPQIGNILTPVSPGNDINSTIFSNSFKYDRGLSFFSAIAPNIKTSINLMGFPQNTKLSIFAGIFMIFPLIIIFSLVSNKKKIVSLTALFFIIVLFFATANITQTWLWLYKNLFYIPGFSMFRNFYGQWQFVYIFFYSILFGQALFLILNKLNKLNKRHGYMLLTTLILIILINAKPFMSGELVRRPLWQSKDVLEVVKMDPDYEKVITFIRSLPADARILTLPLTDPGYQIVAGINGGAYMGPSTIAYLAGKKDITGFEEFQDYKSLILKLINNRQYEELTKLLGFLNIKYIFYNADVNVYDKFPSFPYQQVRKFMPEDQKAYRKFVESLGFNEVKNISNKYFIFELQDRNYLPQIYVAKKTEHFDKSLEEINVPLSIDVGESRIAISNNSEYIEKDYPIKFDEIITDIQGKNSFLDFFTNADFSVGFPYAFSAWPTNSLFYPLVVFRENLQLSKIRQTDDYIETAILIADKRIGELERWGEEIPVLDSVKSIDSFDQLWQDPGMWEALVKRNKYNAWEIGLLRYKREIEDIIDRIEIPNNSSYSTIANKGKLRKAVSADRERFYTIIEKNEKLLKDRKIYLLKLCRGMFSSIESRLQSKIPSSEEISYDLSGLGEGEYQIFIDKKLVEKTDQLKWQVVVNDRIVNLKDFQQDENWYKGQNITIKNSASGTLKLLSTQPKNLLSENQWRLSEENNLGENYVSLSVSENDSPNSNGLVKKIDDWSPRSYYMLSFDYLSHGKSFKVIAYDKSLQKESNPRKVFEDDLISSEWKPYEAIFLSDNDADSAFLQILKSERGLLDTIETKDKNSKIEVKNLSMIKIPNPKIILKKVIASPAQNETLPKITFTKINATKYQIDVKSAMAPYTLVFAEAFNSKWRLVNLDQKTNTLSFGGYLSRLSAGMGNMIGNVLKIGETRENGTISYFGGDIIENYSQNVFLDGDTFNAWGKNEMVPDAHFAVNGYSNAWYIRPEDVGGKTDYSLVLEMGTQKLFYRSLFVSVSAVILCAALLLAKLLKRSS